MDEQNQPDLSTWDDFAGEYLKAEMIKEWPHKLVVVNVEATFDEGKARLIVYTEFNGRKKKFELNKTNQTFIKQNKITSPKALIGKTLICEKVKQRNPKTGQFVDSIAVTGLE